MKRLLLLFFLFPVTLFAQTTELPCPTGTTIVNGPYTQTINPSTGAYRENFCEDVLTGHLIYQGDGEGAASNVINPLSYGAKPDGFFAYGPDVSFTSGSPTITCLSCNFTSTDIGKLAFSTRNGPNAGPSATDAIGFPASTIIGVTDSTHATLSNNATNSCLATALCIFGFGSDNTTAILATDTAFQSAKYCPTVKFPSGYMFINKFAFNTPNNYCQFIPQGYFSGAVQNTAAFMGDSENSSVLVLMPNIDFATCGSHGCLFSTGLQVYIGYLSVYGGWYNNPSGGHTQILVNGVNTTQGATESVFDHVNLIGFGANDGTTRGLGITGYGILDHSYVLGFGNRACSVTISIAKTTIDHSECGNSGNAALTINGNPGAAGAVLNIKNSSFPGTGSTFSTIDNTATGTGIINFDSSYVYAAYNASTTLWFNESSSTGIQINFRDSWLNNSTTNGSGIFASQPTTMTAQNTVFGGAGTGKAVNLSSASSKFIDLGGNTFNNGFTIAGLYLKPGPEGNCTSIAAPAVCGSSGAGSVVVAAAATTVTVNTTAVTANSQIGVQFDSSLGTKLGVTCNTTPDAPSVTARTAGTSFVITVAAAPVTNPACYSYTIVN